jgi:hypothetical protein
MKMKQPITAVTNLRHPTKSEEISMRKLVTAGAFVLISIGAAPAVQAHEFRSFGNGYSVFLGSYVEPAFAGFENGIDIFPASSYTAFDGSHLFGRYGRWRHVQLHNERDPLFEQPASNYS